jgi:hypothetical protein
MDGEFMKIAIYQNNGMLATVLEDIDNPKLVGSELTFDKGSITGIDENHILLDDEAETPETLEEANSLNQMGNLTKVLTPEEENNELKQQLAETNALLLDFMESILA